jgi:CheY-like chemotaxis protein
MKRTVLVVDDDPACADALADTLSDVGYQVWTAASGREALQTLATARPSVIILDLLMPGMTGEEFLEHRAADPPLAEIPVIVLSATTPLRIGDGRTPILRKPIDPVQLLDAIAAVTSQ